MKSLLDNIITQEVKKDSVHTVISALGCVGTIFQRTMYTHPFCVATIPKKDCIDQISPFAHATATPLVRVNMGVFSRIRMSEYV